MSEGGFRVLARGGFTIFLLALYSFLIPLTALADVRKGLFSGKSRGGYKVEVRVVQCQVDNDFPDDLPGVPPPQTHPACAHFEARILAATTLSLRLGQKKVWENIKRLPISQQTYVGALEAGRFVLERNTKPKEALTSGVHLEIYLHNVVDGEAQAAILVKHLSIENTGEEMLLHSKGDVLINPHARQVERLSTFFIQTPLDEKEIWGGQSVLRAPVIKDIPKVYPEHARLWAEVLIKK